MSGHYQEKQRTESELKDEKYCAWTYVLKYYTVTSHEETFPNFPILQAISAQKPLYFPSVIMHKKCLESIKKHWS